MPQPKLLNKAWASDGLKNSIPDTRSGGMPLEGATYTDGFPSITMTPTPCRAGGVRPVVWRMAGRPHPAIPKGQGGRSGQNQPDAGRSRKQTGGSRA